MKTLSLPMKSPAFACVCLLASALTGNSAPAQFKWERTANSVALQNGTQVVWQFNYGTNESKTFFHPLALSGGPVLTWDKPADHRWHRALWFSWKYLNGVNYWEEDAKTGVAAGKTEVQSATIKTAEDFSAAIDLQIAYRPGNETKPVLTEHRVIRVSPPDKNGGYHLDWSMAFKAGDKDVLLDRTPLPDQPNGKPYGGYAGLSIRFADTLKEVQAITTQQQVTFKENRFRGKSLGLDYTGKIGDREVGVAILDHPGNLNSPSPWYVINDKVLRFFSPAVICYEPHTLKAGDTLRLNYRVVVHADRWSTNTLAEFAKSYGQTK